MVFSRAIQWLFPAVSGLACCFAVACEDAPPVQPDSGVDAGVDLALDLPDDPGLEIGEDTDPDGGDIDAPLDSRDDSAPDVADEPDVALDLRSDPDVTDEPVFDAFADLDADLGDPIAISDFFVIENPFNVLSAYAEWTTTIPGDTRVTVDCGDDLQSEIRTPGRTTDHQVFLMGFVAEASCTITAWSTDSGRRTASSEQTFEVPALPEELPEFTIAIPSEDATDEDWEARAPGWTLAPLINLVDRTSHFAVLVDERGRIRWYRELANFGLGSDNDVRIVPEGVLYGSTSERTANAPVIVSWEGEEVWRDASIDMHHHISVDPNDGTYLYLGRDWDCPEGPGTRSDTLNRYDRTTEETVWTWHTCDHYEPEGGHVHDWDHLNAVEVFPGEQALLVSVRNQNQLWRIRLDEEGEPIEWMLGEGGDFAMEEEDYFYHQHAPEFQPDGDILLFDNGLASGRNYSRAIELAYDTEEMTAEVVWEYRHEPDIFSSTMGEADRLGNGNTLVTFTGRTAAQPSVLVEVDAAGEPVWEMAGEPKWTIYRSDRVDARFGYVIQPEDESGDE